VSKNGYSNLAQMPKALQAKPLQKTTKYIPTKVISNTPGRLRLRVNHSHRQKEQMQHLASALEANSNINDVRTNIHHGSITIQHNGDDASLKDIIATLTDLGIIFADITEGNTEAAGQVANAFSDLNQRVENATSGLVDMRFLFPLGLSILSIRQLLAKGLQLEIIPWYVLAWYAFDSFLKLHNNTSQPKSTNE
jgi:Heavy metal associated domain 2